MGKGTILMVDDDANLQLVMEEYLKSDGYVVLKAGSIAAANDKLGMASPDVILLDLNLPDGEGLNLIPLLRMKTKAGIIIVSGKNSTTEKIVCLEMGADDYLTKPFEMRELSARIKAVMRRSENDNRAESSGESHKKERTVDLGNGWILNRNQYQAFNKKNQSADLTTGEFELLNALVNAPNRALSRESLFEMTRDGEFDAYDRAIDIQIARLRKKIEDEDGDIIKTIRGVGYMYVAEAA